MPGQNPNLSATTGCQEKKTTKAPGRNSWTLSWLAEEADGRRGEELSLMLHPTEGLRLRRKGDPALNGEQELCKIETPKCQSGRVPVLSVAVDIEGANTHRIDPAEGWDAVFWTESSVEKFVYPYYHAHRLWDTTMDQVKQAFESYPGAVAIMHKAPSKSFVMNATASLRIGALNLTGKFEWMTVSQFLDVVRVSDLRARGEDPGAADHEPGNPEPAGAR